MKLKKARLSALVYQENISTLESGNGRTQSQAKNAGRNSIRFFDPQMQQELEERLRLVADLEQALLKDQLQLHFQRQVNSQGHTTGRKCCCVGTIRCVA